MEIKFPKGLFVSKREKSPDFVKANLSFKTEEFIEWLKNNTNAKGYCNVDVLESKNNSLYAKLNNWKPEEENEQPTEQPLKAEDMGEVVDENSIDVSQIPF